MTDDQFAVVSVAERQGADHDGVISDDCERTEMDLVGEGAVFFFLI